MFRKPLSTLQTPDTRSRRSTCHNTLSVSKTSRVLNRDTPIFSFTESLDCLDEPKLRKPQLPSLDNLHDTMAPDDYGLSLKAVHSEPVQRLQEGPELIRAKSEISGSRDVLDNTISTMHTLGDYGFTPGRLQDDKEDVITVAEYKQRPQRPRPRPIKTIKSNVDELLSKCKLLTNHVGKINKDTLKTEAEYYKTLDDLDEKLKEPVHKFEFWKVDKKFVRQRSHVKSEVEKFRQVHIEAKKEQDKLHELDHYRSNQGWDAEKEENENLNPIEKMILKKPKSFRIKKMFSKEEQLDLRPKAFDVNVFTEPDTKEKNEVEEILDNLNRLKPLIFGDKDSDKQTNKEIEASISSSSEEGQKENYPGQVCHFAKPKRFCRPMGKGDGTASFKSSFTAFKKSSMTLRSQRG